MSSFSLDEQRKWLSLSGYILVDAALVIALRYCTLLSNPDELYITSTAVVFSEQLKMFFSLLMCLVFEAGGDAKKFIEILKRAFVDGNGTSDMMKLLVPAVLYTIQNNLQYVIETAPLFQVLYNLKFVSTAFFYTLMLSRRINYREWLSIVALVIGVGMVQGSQRDIHPHHAQNIIGLVAVFCACCTSGLGGILFEKILKSSSSSIWIINIQLSLLSTFLSFAECLIKDGEEISKHHFTRGYNIYAIIVVLLQAIVGLMVALVVKYSDNIYKGFATSCSIIFACIIEVNLFHDTTVKIESFTIGSFIVLLSTVVFLMNMHRANAIYVKPSTTTTKNVISIAVEDNTLKEKERNPWLKWLA